MIQAASFLKLIIQLTDMNKDGNRPYEIPAIECGEFFIEGVLCQSMAGVAGEEWDIVDLSKQQ